MRSNSNNQSGWIARAKWAAAVIFLAASATAQTKDPRRQVLVSLPDRKLAVIEDGQVLKVFPVAVGKPSTPSPSGEFTIINRVTNPTYYHKGEVIPAGPRNPVGTRWIGLSQKGYGIHGTNEPRSIGKPASHGCIRMGKRDLEELFSMLRIGDTVIIRGEADEETEQIFGTSSTVVAQAVGTAAGGQ